MTFDLNQRFINLLSRFSISAGASTAKQLIGSPQIFFELKRSKKSKKKFEKSKV